MNASWVRSLQQLLLAIGLCWLALCGALWWWQRDMLYGPTRISLSEARDLAHRLGAEAVENASGELLGWRFGGANCSSQWLLAHGNAGMALQRDFIATRLRAQLGPQTCLTVIEYPGFGAAGGSPSRESLMRQARQLLQQLPVTPVYLIGESLGTGVVGELAAQFPERIAGILLLTPYDDLASVAAEHFSWLPAGWLLRDRFQPVVTLADYPGPVLLIVAGADRVIPPRHAQRLAAALRQPIVQVESGLDHNELESRPAWWSLLSRLVDRTGSIRNE